VASILTNFANLLRDMGTSVALIQRERVSDHLLDTIFWFNMAIGVVLGLIMIAIAVPVSVIFAEPHLRGVLTILAVSYPLSSLAAVHQALLERGLHFRTLAHIELASAIAGLGFGTIAAWRGMGAYSLVLATLVTAALTAVLLWCVSSWRPALRWHGAEFRSLKGFSGNLVGFQIVNYFARNVDTMLVGRFLGVGPLGWYNMGYKLMFLPVQNLSLVVFRALFPVLSRVQTDHAVLRAMYLRAMSAISLVASPVMIGLWVVREPFVRAVFGEQWMPVSVVIAWLAPVGLMQSLLSPVGLLYMVTGRTDLMMRVGTVISAVFFAGILIGLAWGYVGVAIGYAIANALIILPGLRIPFGLVNLSFREFLRSVTPQFIASLLMGLITWTVLLVWGVSTTNAALQLTVLVALGVTLFLSMAVVFMKPTVKQVTDILAKAWSD
jgi:PST family polysaccharide transporter